MNNKEKHHIIVDNVWKKIMSEKMQRLKRHGHRCDYQAYEFTGNVISHLEVVFFLNDVSSYTSNNLERPCSQEVGLSADSCPLQNHNQLISLSNTFISSHFRAVDDNKREVFSLLWHYYVECWEDKKLVIRMLKLRFLIQPSGKIKEGKTEFN